MVPFQIKWINNRNNNDALTSTYSLVSPSELYRLKHQNLPGRPNVESLIVVNLDETLLLNPAGWEKKYKQTTIKRKHIKSDHVTHPLQGLMFSTVFPFLLFSIKKIDFSWIEFNPIWTVFIH